MIALGLPLGEALLVLLQHLRRNLLREVRIGQLLPDLGNLRLDLFEFLGDARLLGGQFLRAAQTNSLKLPPIAGGPFKPDWNSL
jgi:hypothetical protein